MKSTDEKLVLMALVERTDRQVKREVGIVLVAEVGEQGRRITAGLHRSLLISDLILNFLVVYFAI